MLPTGLGAGFRGSLCSRLSFRGGTGGGVVLDTEVLEEFVCSEALSYADSELDPLDRRKIKSLGRGPYCSVGDRRCRSSLYGFWFEIFPRPSGGESSDV